MINLVLVCFLCLSFCSGSQHLECNISMNNIHNGYRYTFTGSISTSELQFHQKTLEVTHADPAIDEVVASLLPGVGDTKKINFRDIDNGVQHQSDKFHLFNHLNRFVIITVQSQQSLPELIEFVESALSQFDDQL